MTLHQVPTSPSALYHERLEDIRRRVARLEADRTDNIQRYSVEDDPDIEWRYSPAFPVWRPYRAGVYEGSLSPLTDLTLTVDPPDNPDTFLYVIAGLEYMHVNPSYAINTALHGAGFYLSNPARRYTFGDTGFDYSQPTVNWEEPAVGYKLRYEGQAEGMQAIATTTTFSASIYHTMSATALHADSTLYMRRRFIRAFVQG